MMTIERRILKKLLAHIIAQETVSDLNDQMLFLAKEQEFEKALKIRELRNKELDKVLGLDELKELEAQL